MPRTLTTDYLVIGAGASGMAVCDELLRHTDAEIIIVDRRHAPGGHWLDAYPFVRLHQPSTFYGVSSMDLGDDAVDTKGFNAGFHELAGAAQICAYYEQLMTQRFVASGRVRYFPTSEHLGEGRFMSRVSGARAEVEVRRRIIDTTYLEGSVPATTPPPFEVDAGVRCVPVGELARVSAPAERYVIVGAGKTALDAIVWLLERGVEASRIQWLKSREAWWLNRKFQQPGELLADLYGGSARTLEAMAQARSVAELFGRLEAAQLYLRVDPRVDATMFRGAILSEAELELLRQVEDVVRLGHVRRIERQTIHLDGGRISTTPHSLHVHCAARGLRRRPLLPLFRPGHLTLQLVRWGSTPLNAALVARVEALGASDALSNQLCQPFPTFDVPADFVRALAISMRNDDARAVHPQLDSWLQSTRLNPTRAPAGGEQPAWMTAARAELERLRPLALASLERMSAALSEAPRR